MEEQKLTREQLESECLLAMQKARSDAMKIAVGALGFAILPFLDNVNALVRHAPQPTGNPWFDLPVALLGASAAVIAAARIEHGAARKRATHMLRAQRLGVEIFPDYPNRKEFLENAQEYWNERKPL